MSDQGNGKNRKRASTGKVSASKKANRKKKPVASDSESDESVHSIPEQVVPLEFDEPDTKLPEELLQSMYKEPGVLMISGQVSWDLTGKRETNKVVRMHPNLNEFHRFTDLKYRLIISGCCSAHSVLVTEDGKGMTFGRNTCGQLGLGDLVTRDTPEEVPALKDINIIHAATGRNHTLFLTDSGIVYACGDNRNGQCGVGSVTQSQLLVPTRINYRGPPIVKVTCGADFSIVLDCKGSAHSFGLPEHGQLGHNTDGKYFVTSTKLSFHFEASPKRIPLFIEKAKDGHVVPIDDVEIIDIACGTNHTVAIDSKKRAYSWGFGGFGRLGHAEQKDEMVPRLIKYFDSQSRGVRSAYCGATYSLVINDLGALFLFGQTKRTGEANMYPKPIQDLAGWNIQSVGAGNTSIIVAADETLIAWGASPTYGELGLGDLTKSSTKPIEVSRMAGTKVSQVCMGYSHSLVLCNDTSEQVKEKLEKFPVFEM